MRPPYEQLLAEVRSLGCRSVGRRYGVSDNAIRKWIRRYERELSVESGAAGAAGPDVGDPPGTEGRA